ncbi:MAG: ferrous iron transporter B [Vicinamibacterales bacterium]
MSTAVVDARPQTAPARLALVGNPNTGKTTLFNELCGLRARTSNYPGTTTAVRVGHMPASDRHGSVEVVDLPGLYDLQGSTPEALVAANALNPAGRLRADVVLVVVDASNLARNLIIVGEVLAQSRPVVVALNMMDVARSRGIGVDVERLSQRLGCPVVPVVARRGEGIDALRHAMREAATANRVAPADLPPAPASLEALATWGAAVADACSSAPPDLTATDRLTERLDRFLTHPISGVATFIAIMCALFWTLFTLAAVPMDLIEALFGSLSEALSAVIPAGPVQDLVTQGIIGGLSGTVVFLPQICLLFFLISLLEDTGYLARAAFVMDGALSRFGLPGQSFVPLLTAHACALPGIMSARLIPNERDRLATILIAPFMSCSARLPVYVLLTSLLFAGQPALAGVAFAACYLLGAIAGLFTAWLFGRTALKGRPQPLILELPSYRTPSVKNALLAAKDQGMAFLRTAGTVIMAICIVMWWLSAYPRPDVPDAGTATVAAAAADTGAVDTKAAQASSYAGQFGKLAQPLFEPLGFDWQLTVGVVTSFLAREVFVSTMAVLEGGAGDTEVDEGVVSRIRAMTRDDGTPLFTPATAATALVFFVLAMQCLPTLAVTRKETGSGKYAVIQLAYMSSLAYVLAFLVNRGLALAGVA